VSTSAITARASQIEVAERELFRNVIGLKIRGLETKSGRYTIHGKTHDSAKPEPHALDISHPLESNQKSAHPGHTSRIVSE
jgi:hypothetical protein